MKNKYARVFAMVAEINASGANTTYKDLLWDFTKDREAGQTKSLGDLTEFELREFETCLQRLKTNPTKSASDYANDPLDAQRKAIIAQFKSMGLTAYHAKAWAEKYGVSGVKRNFNEYTANELYVLTKNAEKVKDEFIAKANKNFYERV